MKKKYDPPELVQTSSRGENSDSEGLRQRKGMNPQVIGCPLHVDALDIRLPKQETPFTQEDIDIFLVTSRLRTLKVITAVVSTILLLDTVHKCIIWGHTYIDWEHFLAGVGIQMIIILCLTVMHVLLKKFGNRLTLKCTECIAMGSYVLVLALYLYLAVKWSTTLQEYNDQRNAYVDKCIRRLNQEVSNGSEPGEWEIGQVYGHFPQAARPVAEATEKLSVCYNAFQNDIFVYFSNLNFHEMMAFAISCFLIVVMPLNPIFVFVCQNLLTWTLAAYWVHWDLCKDRGTQNIMLVLAPRILLSLACTGFAMHQQRYLSIIVKDYELTKRAVNPDYNSHNLSLLNRFVGMGSSGQNFGCQDIEDPWPGPLNVVQPSVMEDFAAGALNVAQSMSPTDLECSAGGNPFTVNSNPEIAPAEQGVQSAAWQVVPESSNCHFLEPQQASRTSGAPTQSLHTSIPHVNLAEQNYIVRNTFVEMVGPPQSSQSFVQRENYFLAWTDERAGVEYKSYPCLCLSPTSHPRDESNHVVSLTLSSDSGVSDQLTETSVSSNSDNEHADVVLAEEVVGKGEVATSKRAVFLSEMSRVPRHPETGELMSIGSASHFQGACKPCEWLQRGRSCKFEWRCPYCHFTDGHVAYNRGKAKHTKKMR